MFFSLIAVFVLVAAVPAQERTIAVIPFAVHGSGEYRHMEHSAPEMFSSRLGSLPGYNPISSSKVKALDIDPAEMDFDSAVAAGRELDADFVLYGSVTAIGQAWSMDAVLVDAAEGRRLDSFSRSGTEGSGLIAGVDELAAEMKDVLEKDADQIKKPESARPSAEKEPKEPESPGAGFQVAEPTRAKVPGTWTGPRLDGKFAGITAGDVTGDGETEAVLIDGDSVYIYKVSDRSFTRREKIDAPSNTQCIAVDAGDINENGRAEIFVTARNNAGNALRSFVLEYKDGGYETILEKSPWFYRVLDHPDGGRMLFGQRHKRSRDPFKSQVVRLESSRGRYEPGEYAEGPESGVNVLGFAMGSFRGDGTESVAFDDGRRLQVFDGTGSKVWTSRREYGGISLFLEGKKTGRGDEPERFYLPGRIVAGGGMFSGTGEPERLFVFRNFDPSPVSLMRLKVYSGGEILSLAWDGSGLREEWKTREYEGYFRDMCLADLDGDGKNELAALLVEGDSPVDFSSARSRVMVFPLQEAGGK